MSNPTVLVVIPVYNRRRLVTDALRCVAQQTRPPHALVVIDDGSTDGSDEVVRAFFDAERLTFPTQLIRQDNAGVGAARSRAIAQAPPCDLLAMLDSDDLWPPDYLEKMAASLARDPRVVGASCDRLVVDAVSEEKELKPSSHLTGAATCAIFTRGTSPSSATVVRMDAYHRAGGYDTSLRYKDDADLYLRMSLLGPWCYVPELTVTLRRNTTTTHGGPQHLTHKSIPNRLEMVTLLERFIAEQGGGDVIPTHVWSPHLARLWFRLGRELADDAREPEAAWCFQRATELRPLHLRAWLRRLIGGSPRKPLP